MATLPLVVVLCLLMHSSCLGQTEIGCKAWDFNEKTDAVCCHECHPGNFLVSKCGLKARELCKPCPSGTYTDTLTSDQCRRCTTCVGALVQLEACTPTADTKCGCKKGLVCGDNPCSFCVTECKIGEEPTPDRSCAPCPEGTFNDQIHQKCKPWSKTCPNPNQFIEAPGDAFGDIKCADVPLTASTEYQWVLVPVVLTVALIGFICIVAAKIFHIRKSGTKKKTITKPPIIRIPTDDPTTLIAMECSFHEAQQEQGSSTESLDSKDSSDMLIA